jgi:hypothetical protein
MRLTMPTVLVLTGALFTTRSSLSQAGPESVCADMNGDAAVNISDAVYLLNYLFLGGQAPVCSVTQVDGEPPSCESFSRKAVEACKHEALGDYWRARAMCDLAADPADAARCREAARKHLNSTLDDCQAQLDSRLEACQFLGAPPFNLAIDPRDFVVGIDNPYFPLTPGSTLIYESQTDEGTRRQEVSVTFDTRRILDVECVVVRITGTLNSEFVEEGEEWFAQDAGGNVWNFGEWSFDVEDSNVADWFQWQAGIDGAKPGIVMKGNPQPGDVYFQSLAIGVSEDIGRVMSTSEAISLATPSIGPFKDCVQVEEFSVLEDEVEDKFFAPGFGVVLEVNPKTGQSTELVEKRSGLGR